MQQSAFNSHTLPRKGLLLNPPPLFTKKRDFKGNIK
nr:MAG TPA: hypothetical protein [Caudoviricetes sp.]